MPDHITLDRIRFVLTWMLTVIICGLIFSTAFWDAGLF
jgi:hypothetical protein